MPCCALLVTLLIALGPTPPGQDGPPAEWHGYSSGITTPGEYVIESPEAWGELWARHQAIFSPPPPFPTLILRGTGSSRSSRARGRAGDTRLNS